MPPPGRMKVKGGTMFYHQQGVVPMRSFVLPMVLSVAVLAASTGVGQAAGGLLARLNKSIVPTAPGLPTASPLGLLSPRLSNAASIFQLGGMRTPAGRLAGLGVVSPRISPLVGMMRMPLTPASSRMYVLTMISPRATALVGILKGMRGFTAGIR